MTEAEYQEIAGRVAAILRSQSKGVGDLPKTETFDDIYSLPAIRWLENIPEVVEAPLVLIKQAAINHATPAIELAQQATINANQAANNANEQATLTANATNEAVIATGLTVIAKNNAQQAASQASSAVSEAEEVIARMEDLEHSVVVNSSLAPTSMTLTYPQKLTLRNNTNQTIQAQLSPSYVMPNVLFLRLEGRSIRINPATGKLTLLATGITKIQAIPTNNTQISQTIEIEVIAPSIRLTSDCRMRLCNNETIRLT
ncbi:hypothetical protein FACS1894195_4960 [Bacteroidia bacterium]|nr:hypothetical protein FACS1894195_4960 [Bacteroidia bacterium]